MLNNFRNLRSLFGSHGLRWLLFRVAYTLRKRTGYIRKQMPQYRWQDRPLATWLKPGIPFESEAYTRWRKQNSPLFFRTDQSNTDDRRWHSQAAIEEADRILSGEFKYFAHTHDQVGFPPKWHRDPVTGRTLDSHKHWSELSDDADFDIKFIWEASRFAMVYPLVRAYASTRDEKYAQAFWELIESWAQANPPNSGPNWMDGQEAALRLFAWTFGYSQFSASPSSTSERIAQFTVMVAAHAERIDKNIGYALSTHSNHTISEAFGLWLVGLLFPELQHAEKYLAFGRQLLEQEAVAQIFPDGSYSMYSLNYHRFILHIYLCVLRLAELNRSSLSGLIRARVSSSMDFLYQLIDAETGKMPAYGSNDGALVLPLNDCDFTDYRPLLQLGFYITRKQLPFEPGLWDEDIFWLCGADVLPQRERVEWSERSSFPYGGIYLLRGSNSKAIIRCADIRSRPSHADQLHVDLWLGSQNIACDAGTYLYSGPEPWRNGLAHTAVHNTVTVDHFDQMKMLSRFTWTNRSSGKVLDHRETIWQGEQNGYKRLADPVRHQRIVKLLGDDRWWIVDYLSGRESHHYALQWLLNDVPFLRDGNSITLTLNSMKYKAQFGLLEGKSSFSIVRADPGSTRGWRSQYYGEKEPAISIMLEADQPEVCFWSYFGFEADSLTLTQKTLNLATENGNISVDLKSIFPAR